MFSVKKYTIFSWCTNTVFHTRVQSISIHIKKYKATASATFFGYTQIIPQEYHRTVINHLFRYSLELSSQHSSMHSELIMHV